MGRHHVRGRHALLWVALAVGLLFGLAPFVSIAPVDAPQVAVQVAPPVPAHVAPVAPVQVSPVHASPVQRHAVRHVVRAAHSRATQARLYVVRHVPRHVGAHPRRHSHGSHCHRASRSS